jgi:hypothetical protein
MVEHVFAIRELRPEGENLKRNGLGNRRGVSHRHILQRIRRLGPPGVAGAESVGVRGNFANISVSGAEPSPSTTDFSARQQRCNAKMMLLMISSTALSK